jgi:hypothetical protein
MIGFQNQGAASAQAFGHQAGDNTEVRGNTDFALFPKERKTNRSQRIVGDGERAHVQVVDGKIFTGNKFMYTLRFADIRQLPGQIGLQVNREIKLADQWAETTDMIRMFMGDQQCVNVLDGYPDQFQTTAQLPRRKAGIDQETGTARFDQQGIPFTATCQQADSHA